MRPGLFSGWEFLKIKIMEEILMELILIAILSLSAVFTAYIIRTAPEYDETTNTYYKKGSIIKKKRK